MNTPEASEAEFYTALQGQDELGVVVRAHIYVEAMLNTLIDRLLASPKHVEKMNLDYSQKVRLAIALGLHPQYESPLLALGTLRNAFAHKLGTSLSKSRVDSLYSALSAEDKTAVQNSHQLTRKRLKEPKVPRFSELGPKDQFILIAVALRGLLAVASCQVPDRSHGV